LTANISTEIARLDGSIAQKQTNINQEISDRQSACTALGNRIDSEAASRSSADTALSATIATLFVAGTALSASGATISGLLTAGSIVSNAGVSAVSGAFSEGVAMMSNQITSLAYTMGTGYTSVAADAGMEVTNTFNPLTMGI